MGKNDKTNIQHPEAWELLVAIGDQQLDYILYAPTVAGSLQMGHASRTDDSLQALEDATYDTPDLLNDYKRVRVVVHSQHFVLLPMETSDEDCAELVRTAFPADDGEAAVCALPQNGVKVAYLMPRGMQAFLGRTFSFPEVYHHLFPLCEYFKSLNRSDDLSRMFLNLNAEMETQGTIGGERSTNIASPKISTKYFKAGTHFGEGVWNIQNHPVIYVLGDAFWSNVKNFLTYSK